MGIGCRCIYWGGNRPPSFLLHLALLPTTLFDYQLVEITSSISSFSCKRRLQGVRSPQRIWFSSAFWSIRSGGSGGVSRRLESALAAEVEQAWRTLRLRQGSATSPSTGNTGGLSSALSVELFSRPMPILLFDPLEGRCNMSFFLPGLFVLFLYVSYLSIISFLLPP